MRSSYFYLYKFATYTFGAVFCFVASLFPNFFGFKSHYFSSLFQGRDLPTERIPMYTFYMHRTSNSMINRFLHLWTMEPLFPRTEHGHRGESIGDMVDRNFREIAEIGMKSAEDLSTMPFDAWCSEFFYKNPGIVKHPTLPIELWYNDKTVPHYKGNTILETPSIHKIDTTITDESFDVVAEFKHMHGGNFVTRSYTNWDNAAAIPRNTKLSTPEKYEKLNEALCHPFYPKKPRSVWTETVTEFATPFTTQPDGTRLYQRVVNIDSTAHFKSANPDIQIWPIGDIKAEVTIRSSDFAISQRLNKDNTILNGFFDFITHNPAFKHKSWAKLYKFLENFNFVPGFNSHTHRTIKYGFMDWFFICELHYYYINIVFLIFLYMALFYLLCLFFRYGMVISLWLDLRSQPYYWNLKLQILFKKIIYFYYFLRSNLTLIIFKKKFFYYIIRNIRIVRNNPIKLFLNFIKTTFAVVFFLVTVLPFRCVRFFIFLLAKRAILTYFKVKYKITVMFLNNFTIPYLLGFFETVILETIFYNYYYICLRMLGFVNFFIKHRRFLPFYNSILTSLVSFFIE